MSINVFYLTVVYKVYLICNCFMLQDVTSVGDMVLCVTRVLARWLAAARTLGVLWLAERRSKSWATEAEHVRRWTEAFNGVTNAVQKALSARYSMDGAQRTRVSLLGCVALFLGAVNAFSPTDSEFTFLLPAASKECFYQSAVQNGSVEIEYQVTDRSDLSHINTHGEQRTLWADTPPATASERSRRAVCGLQTSFTERLVPETFRTFV